MIMGEKLHLLKKNSVKFGIVTLLILTILFSAACSSSTPGTQSAAPPATSQSTGIPATTANTGIPATSQSTPQSPASTQPVPSSAPASTPAAGGTLSDILGKAAGIPSMKYEMVTTLNNQTTTATVWVKNKKMRMETTEQGQNVIILIDTNAKTMYMYSPEQNMAFKMDFSQAPQSATNEADAILQYTPTVVGTETINGIPCEVIQYNAKGEMTKAWIWQAKGLPVRVQATTAQGTSTTDFKNYDFSDIPDSQFALPAGVQVTTLGLPPGMPTGMPSGLPTGLPSGLPTGLPTNLPGGQ